MGPPKSSCSSVSPGAETLQILPMQSRHSFQVECFFHSFVEFTSLTVMKPQLLLSCKETFNASQKSRFYKGFRRRFLALSPFAPPGLLPPSPALLTNLLSSQVSPGAAPMAGRWLQRVGTVKEKNGQLPLADALNVLFRLRVHLLEIGDPDNKNHASSLEKMSNYTKT